MISNRRASKFLTRICFCMFGLWMLIVARRAKPKDASSNINTPSFLRGSNPEGCFASHPDFDVNNDVQGSKSGLLFHFIVSKLPFDAKQRRSVESVFKYHPAACVAIHVQDDLELSHMEKVVARFRHQQYCIRLQRYSLATALKTLENCYGRDLSEAAAAFSNKLGAYTNGPHWYSHQTDFMRFFILHAFGGWYLDTDVIVIRQLDEFQNVIGKQATDGTTEHNTPLLYLNGSVMNFSRGNAFIKWALKEFLISYNPHIWGANGPELLSALAQKIDKCEEAMHSNCSLHILPVEAFQPVHFLNISMALNSKKIDFGRETYAFHYNNKVTHNHTILMRRDTLAHQLFNQHCIFCEEELM